MDANREAEDEEIFFRDIAECVITNRDSGPALVWPQGGDAILQSIAVAHDHAADLGGGPGAFTDPPVTDPPEPAVKLIVHRLHTLIGGSAISASYRDLAAGQRTGDVVREYDILLFTVRGGIECRVGATVRTGWTPSRNLPLALRMRFGEVLYVPRLFPFSIAEAHTPSTLLELGLLEGP
jgi:hypothetical protein